MKKVLLTVTALTLLSSVAMASPVNDLQKGESVVGYSYWNTKVKADPIDFGKTNASGFYAETAIDDHFIVGVETIKGDKSAVFSGISVSADTKFTDVSLKYKIDKNFQLIVGNRNYDTTATAAGLSASQSTDKFFYGVGATTEIAKNTSAYASYLHNDISNDYQVGVKYDIDKNTALNVNYRSYSEDGFSLKGVGAGLAYKF